MGGTHRTIHQVRLQRNYRRLRARLLPGFVPTGPHSPEGTDGNAYVGCEVPAEFVHGPCGLKGRTLRRVFRAGVHASLSSGLCSQTGWGRKVCCCTGHSRGFPQANAFARQEELNVQGRKQRFDGFDVNCWRETCLAEVSRYNADNIARGSHVWTAKDPDLKEACVNEQTEVTNSRARLGTHVQPGLRTKCSHGSAKLRGNWGSTKSPNNSSESTKESPPCTVRGRSLRIKCEHLLPMLPANATKRGSPVLRAIHPIVLPQATTQWLSARPYINMYICMCSWLCWTPSEAGFP